MTDLSLDDLRLAFADRFDVLRELGHGGMASVYLARDRKHDREVALKVLHPDLARSITGERFLREVAIAAKLNHPHVLALLDSGEAGGGEYLYYVMPVATGESLRSRLDREGPLPVADAVKLGTEVAEALAHAHAAGIVHRDIKPENVLLSSGHAVVADFGIAKAIGQSLGNPTLTADGSSVGTPVYMAPEQVAGDGRTDYRADIYALGVLLYESLTGAPPFGRSMPQMLTNKLTEPAPSLAARVPGAPAALVKLLARCLERDPDARYQSAEDVLRDLHAIGAPASSHTRRNRALAAVGVVVLALLSLAFLRDRRTRWAHETAIPEIERLIEADKLDSAFALATRVEEISPGDARLAPLWGRVSERHEFHSEPEGAVVTRAPFGDTTSWLPVGTTPTTRMRIPADAWLYRFSKPGYRDAIVMGAHRGGSRVPIPASVPLRRTSDPDTDMVLLRGGKLVGTLYGLSVRDTFELADFLMDRMEVTNRQYKAFVDAGGYGRRELWDSAVVHDGRSMAAFVDRTGRPGPSAWEGGAPAGDALDLPVGGVSWHEARAYARFVGKELPTVYEWNAAAVPDAGRWVVPLGRYYSNGPIRGGTRGAGPRGVYDLAGNVREWTVNATTPGNRYILGGGWNDPSYQYSEIFAQPELNRSPTNGIRLIRRLGQGRDIARASAPVPGLVRDYNKVRPVDDASFQNFLSLYDYDHTPLKARLESRDTTNSDWVRERVSFEAVPGTRTPAVVFLPKHGTPPYQTVLIWPASNAFIIRDSRDMPLIFVDFVVRSGRAVIFPIYESTFERGNGLDADLPDSSIAHRDQMLRWAKEMRRSVDYLVTRGDIDTTRLAFLGTSWGGRIGGVMVAVEPRFTTAILYIAGLSMSISRPEEDPVNFLPRIHIPVLMLNGKYDSGFPYELSQKPFFNLLGTPVGRKKQIVFEGGHFLPRTEMVTESLRWLDEQLGVPKR